MTTYTHKHQVEALQTPFDIIIIRPKSNGRKEERLPCPAMGYIVRQGDSLITMSKEQFDKNYQPRKKPETTIRLSVGEWTQIDDEDDDYFEEKFTD